MRTLYNRRNLMKSILDALRQDGIDLSRLSPEDLAPVDEFHYGGIQATQWFARLLEISPQHKVLDLGCGLGGMARYLAKHTGAQVTGVDLSSDYVAAGLELNHLTGLESRVALLEADVSQLPFKAASFDRILMVHVGMNIPDKKRVFREMRRCLKPGGRIGIYDQIRCGTAALDFPMPWTEESHTSHAGTMAEYEEAIGQAGFCIISTTEFTAQLKRPAKDKALGLDILMGESTAQKVSNLVSAIKQGHLKPCLIMAE